MLRDRRGLLILLALVGLLGIVAWGYFGSGGTTPVAARQETGTRRQSTAAPDPLPTAEGVRLASLQQAREEPSEATRNPFKFERRSASGGRTGDDAPTPVFTPAPAEPAPAAAGPPPLPPIPLKFIGVVEKEDGVRWAVLSLGDGRPPLHGKEGDIIDGRYRILKIGTESIDLAYHDGRGQQTIRLTGQ